MKIGLLTYHHVANSGSVLQTFCAYRFLCDLHPRARVEIVDYVPEESRTFNEESSLRSKEWKRNRKSFDRFLRSGCNFSPFRLRRKDNESATREFYEHADYDRVYVGSDTVFQINGYFGRYIAGPAAPNLYFLPDHPFSRATGLAVSCDPFNERDLTPERTAAIGRHLRGFDSILYRDSTTEEVLRQLGVEAQNLAYCPDPTILLNPSFLVSGDSQSVTGDNQAGVAISNQAIRDAAKTFLRKRGFAPIDVLHPRELRRQLGFKDAVRDHLNTYRRLGALITDRFHGSILALQLGEGPVIGIEDASRYQRPNSKLRDLFSRLALEGRLLRLHPDNVREVDFNAVWESAIEPKAEIMARFALLRSQGLRNFADFA